MKTSSIPNHFILPEDKRPHLSEVSSLDSIPIIDLIDYTENGDVPSTLLEKLSSACEEYGFFQIINHGVPEELCDRVMSVVSDFYDLTAEERKQFYTTDHSKEVKLYNYYLKNGEDKVSMWSECFCHPWHPTQPTTHFLPQNPPQYRETFAVYAKEIGGLMNKLLRLLSRGLGLEDDHLKKRLGDNPSLVAQSNHYPPCPDPELTLGLATHTDFKMVLTVLNQSQGVTGLQVIKDGKWVSVDPIPNSFVINLGDQMQVLSNGRYKSVHHRAVTNESQRRLSLAMFYGPNKDSVIGPIEELIDEKHPPLYRNYYFSEFLEEYNKQDGTRRMVKEVFELRNNEMF